MRYRPLTEKQAYRQQRDTDRTSRFVICLLLHGLLGTSMYIIGSTLYVTISTKITDETLLVPAVIAAMTALVSIIYVVLHNIIAYMSRCSQPESKVRQRARVQSAATIAIRMALTMWLVSSGLSVTFTLARHPDCSATTVRGPTRIDTGTVCRIQRSIIGASLLALTLSLILFIITAKTEDPFRSHLFGVAKEQTLLPLMLPYKASLQKPLFSEMSFKCRSSTSLCSNTLVPSCDSMTTLLPANPDKVVGLGIYAPKTSTASFLGPRPSLSSIRTQTSIGSAPPSSPLPPLPAYFPEKYRQRSAMHKAIYPPRRPPRPKRSKSERTVRIVPPSPALSIANLKIHNNSMESLSSVYSRSISGESHSARQMRRPTMLTDGSRSYSSGSTATIIKSPLGVMSLADRPDVVVTHEKTRTSIDSDTTEIDDVVTLQAKLPSVKAVSEFGDVLAWSNLGKTLENVRPNDNGPYMVESKKRSWKPLTVRKNRDSESMFQCSSIKALA